MMPVGDVAASIIEMQGLLIGTESVEGFLTEVAGLAVTTIGTDLSCGITLQPDGMPLTVVSTDALAARLDEVQYGLDQGPCLHAMRTGSRVLIADAATDQRWAGFGTRAAASGIGSSLSLPLGAGGKTFGAFNLYSPRTGTFDAASIERAAGFAQIATGALAVAVRIAEQAVLTTQLRASLATRSVIDKAVGILMAQRGCAAEQAFAVLRKTSQDRNTKVQTVAARIVAATGGAEPGEPRFDPPTAPRTP